MQIPAVIRPQRMAVEPPLGNASDNEAESAVHEFKIANDNLSCTLESQNLMGVGNLVHCVYSPKHGQWREVPLQLLFEAQSSELRIIDGATMAAGRIPPQSKGGFSLLHSDALSSATMMDRTE